MNLVDKKSAVIQLEYWLLKPFSFPKDVESPIVKEILALIQSLQEGSDSREKALERLEELFELNKMRYEYVDRKYIRKGIYNMKNSVISRMISQKVVPVTNKITEKVGPIVKQTMTGTVIPAADKTLRFLHKVFVKKKIEVREVSKETSEIISI